MVFASSPSRRRWLALLFAVLFGCWLGLYSHAYAKETAVPVYVQMDPVDLTVQLEPAELAFDAVSILLPQERTQTIRVTNAGNVDFLRIRAAIAAEDDIVDGWTFTTKNDELYNLLPGEYRVQVRQTKSGEWKSLHRENDIWQYAVEEKVSPGEQREIDVRLGLGPNMPTGSGRFDLLLQVVH